MQSHSHSPQNPQHSASQQPSGKQARKKETGSNADGSVFLQTKLTVNTPGDRYEREADAVADRIMRMPNGAALTQPSLTPVQGIQRKCATCEEEESVLQRKEQSSGAIASPTIASQLAGSQGRGRPLPGVTQGFMGRAIGADFSGVRVHTDGAAAQMNQQLNARAFTYGSDIYFNRGEYAPESPAGRRLLGHELAHVVQQGMGLRHDAIQREGDEKKSKETNPVKTKIEVVSEYDFDERKANITGTTTRSAEQPITKGVDAKVSEKRTDKGTTATVGVEAKNKTTGLFASGGIKAQSPADPTTPDTANVFIKVDGKWKPFSQLVQLGVSSAVEFDFKKTPKLSADVKTVFFPNGALSLEIAAGLILNEKGFSGKIDPSIIYKINEVISLKAGATLELGPGNKLSAPKPYLGLTITFP